MIRDSLFFSSVSRARDPPCTTLKYVTSNSKRSTGEQYLLFQITVHWCFFFSFTQKGIRRLLQFYCNNVNNVLAFSSFKEGSPLSVEGPISSGLRSCVVYKFSCAGCAACYVVETSRHFNTRVREHLTTDRALHIFKHLQSSETCRSVYSPAIFELSILCSNYYYHYYKFSLLFLLYSSPCSNHTEDGRCIWRNMFAKSAVFS